MAEYRQKRIVGVTDDRWVRISTLSALIGGGLLALIGVALHSVLNEAQFAIVDPLGVVAMILLALGLPVLYLSERHWFGSPAKVSFGLMAAGWIIAAIALPIAVFGPGVIFLVFLLGLLVAMLGAFAFGIVMVRSEALRVPQLGAWLLIAALPIGLPFTVAFTGYVMGEFADPWGGPMLLYGLAWVLFANYLRTHQHEVVPSTAISK